MSDQVLYAAGPDEVIEYTNLVEINSGEASGSLLVPTSTENPQIMIFGIGPRSRQAEEDK